ncbi:hypothetical protein [Symbioplanes lichenis]|uniref:hypothetical protein n=1 Tax=Symbioplanes lichenis TaxID=1629072 RepID=UPI002739B07C|nr:hypothetical protein [Actinoplanes lichenis]
MTTPSPGRFGALQPIANKCASSSCPTVYRSDTPGVLVVQGFSVTPQEAGLDVPDGEMLIEIPVELLREAARHL